MTNPTEKPFDLATLAEHYGDDNSARALFESIRWPHGPVCPHCNASGYYVIKGSAMCKRPARAGLYKCKTCWRQYTVTVGTIMEESKIPIRKWLMAFFIIGSSKKAVSSHQLHRMLGVTYKTAWFLSHRIRHSLTPLAPKKLTGTVEVDEAFVGPKSDVKHNKSSKSAVVALVERKGEVRVQVIASVTHKNIKRILDECVAKDAILNTDEHAAYTQHGKTYKAHAVVNHSKKEFNRTQADGSLASVNYCESFFSLLRRGIVGSFHHISREHLPRYANEFAFRWNTRKLDDGERFKKAIGEVEGKRLKYRNCV